MFFALLYLMFTTSLLGSNQIYISKKYTILDFPLEIRTNIVEFLHKPSEKCLLFSNYERNDDKFYYGTLLRRNLDDIIWCVAVDNIRSQNYELSSEGNKIFCLATCKKLGEKLNALYNIFITNPHNALKYYHGSWFDQDIEKKLSEMENKFKELWKDEHKELSPAKRENKLKKLCPKTNVITSGTVNNENSQITVITENDNNITIHKIYGNPIEYIGTNILPFCTFPSRIITCSNFTNSDFFVDFFSANFSFLVNIIQDQCGETLLTKAIKNNHMDLVKLLLQAGLDVNTKTAYGDTPLSVAIENDNVDMVKLLVHNWKADVNAKNHYGRPLIHAIKNNNEAIIRLLIQAEANINSQNDEGLTPLLYAIRHRKPEIIRLLIDLGADIDVKNKCCVTPLMLAVKMDNKEFAKLLIDKGAIIGIKNHKWVNETPIFDAIRKKNIALVKLLADGKAGNELNINATNKEGITPLMLASLVEGGNSSQITEFLVNHKNGKISKNLLFDFIKKDKVLTNERLIQLLFESKKIKINDENDENLTPLLAAIKWGRKKVLEFLIGRFEAPINGKNSKGLTPLLAAIGTNNMEIIDLLIGKGADVDTKNKYGETPIFDAIRQENVELIKLLVKGKAKINSANNKDTTPLLAAIETKNMEIVELLIKNGADVNVKNGGETPVFDAIREANIGLIKLLLHCKIGTKEANINSTNNDDIIPFVRDSIKKAYVKMVELLVKGGMAINKGKTPIYDFLCNNNIGLAKLLHKRKEIINAKNAWGLTPLCVAIEKNNFEIVKLLVEHGAQVNAQNDQDEIPFFPTEKETPLRVAMETNNIEIIKFLVEHRADVNVESNNGKTPLLIAIDENKEITVDENKRIIIDENMEIIKLLIEWGVNIHGSNKEGRKPLLAAIDQDNVRIIELLVQHGADYKTEFIFEEKIMVQGKEKTVYKYKTPLLYAIQQSKIKSVKFLIAHGSNIHIKNRDGMTPLIAAIGQDNLEIVKLLLEHGADINTKTDKGKTALYIAIENNNEELVDFLIAHGAKDGI